MSMAIKKTPPKKPQVPLKPGAVVFFTSSWIMLIIGVILTSLGGLYFATTGQLLSPKSLIEPSSWGGIVATSGEATKTNSLDKMETLTDTADARAVLVANFLKRYNSPMKPYDYFGKKLVEIADQQNMDFRLLPAIAMQESNLCKVIPPGTYNCLGLGIHAQGTWGFNSYEENFAMAAKILKNNYIDIGLVTPEQIMTKYTPSSNGSWAFSVNRWMREIRYDDPALGRAGEDDADLLEFVNESEP